jgi:hypothetical protein
MDGQHKIWPKLFKETTFFPVKGEVPKKEPGNMADASQDGVALEPSGTIRTIPRRNASGRSKNQFNVMPPASQCTGHGMQLRRRPSSTSLDIIMVIEERNSHRASAS